MNKNELRSYYLNLRDNLSLEEQNELSNNIFLLFKEQFVKYKKDILIFVNIKSEVKTLNLIAELLDDGSNRIFVPKVIGENIEFYQITDISELSKGYMGILEPDIDKYTLSSDYSYDSIIIMPGAVYDIKGNRIGYGGGFYDRFLNEHNNMLKVGIIYEIQLSKDLIKSEKHDVRVDYIITDKGIIDTNE